MIYPSIDLSEGKAVQLVSGRTKALERDDPLALAEAFSRFGEIAVIDLDAAMEKGDNRALVREICRIAPCRVGGGIRTVEAAREALSLGAVKVIVGTRAFRDDRVDSAFLEELSKAIGRNRVIVAIDAENGEIVTRGWRHRTGLRVLPAVRELEPWVSEFLFTVVEKEGRMAGTDMSAIREIREQTRRPIIAAGGVASLSEIEELARAHIHVQLGMALYTGKIDLAEGFIASLDWSKGLIPTVTTDREGQVLMVAYSSRESLQKTLARGMMWYFSRSRNRLWQKGEASGHVQKLARIWMDCDQDTLLAEVEQQGNACHLERYSCFADKRFGLGELYNVVAERFLRPEVGSYTASLTPEKVRAKLLEEALEVTEASSRDEVIWEAADVLYFLTVLLQQQGVGYEEVYHELRRRRWQPRRTG